MYAHLAVDDLNGRIRTRIRGDGERVESPQPADVFLRSVRCVMASQVSGCGSSV